MIDFQFRLELDDGNVVLECPFSYGDAVGRIWILDPQGPRPALAPALVLFGTKVERAVAYENGKLDMAFDDGGVLLVEPDPMYEAWQARGSWGLMVAAAGGGLVVWSS